MWRVVRALNYSLRVFVGTSLWPKNFSNLRQNIILVWEYIYLKLIFFTLKYVFCLKLTSLQYCFCPALMSPDCLGMGKILKPFTLKANNHKSLFGLFCFILGTLYVGTRSSEASIWNFEHVPFSLSTKTVCEQVQFLEAIINNKQPQTLI